MLGKLLIAGKNGRSVKPYGLNRLAQYNMKYNFICIVILISCSVCASGDLKTYPVSGFKYDLSEEQRERLIDSTEDGTALFAPWLKIRNYGENRKQQHHFGSSLPERLRDLIERNRNQPKKLEALPYYHHQNAIRNLDEDEDVYDDYRNAGKYASYRFAYPNSPILDDVRQYPHDDDFSFRDDGDDDDDGGGGEEADKHGYHGSRATGAGSGAGSSPWEQATHHGHQIVMDSVSGRQATEKVAGKWALDEIKFVEDPTTFAYPPSDPRFFRDTDHDRVAAIGPEPEQSKFGNILLNQRSDLKFANLDDDASNTLLRTNGEFHTSNRPLEVVSVRQHEQDPSSSPEIFIIAVVAGISAAATVGLIAIGIGWYNLQKHVKSATDVEYPAYGVTGPNKDVSPSGDRRLAQSAQMYHYQHQKQQIIAMERAAAGDRHGSVSEADSDEENEEGDYTVYECPGLAPAGEMEVKNPLFQDDPTPAPVTPVKPTQEEDKK